MSRFLNPAHADLTAYVPGEQPRDRVYIKLNTNESPFPPSPGVLAAVQAEVSKLHLYPDPEAAELREALAGLLGLEPGEILAGNGSDELLLLAFMAFGGRGVCYPDITYGFYRVYAQLLGERAETAPLGPDFEVRPEDYFGKTGLVVIANPNAPTGLCLTVDQIEAILKNSPDSVVLIDEAYVAFGGESCLPLLGRYENLMVLRTYSKSRSLAGARLGFVCAAPALIEDLKRIKYSINPYNVNRLTQAAGLACVRDNDYYLANCREVMRVRAWAAQALEKLGFESTDSKANFIFTKHRSFPGKLLLEKLREKSVLVRRFDTPRIENYLRITVGSAEQMQALVTALEEIIGGEA